jgi:hypothetical protein
MTSDTSTDGSIAQRRVQSDGLKDKDSGSTPTFSLVVRHLLATLLAMIAALFPFVFA